jgi:guanylate kinase
MGAHLVLMGPAGVGKSSLIRGLTGEQVACGKYEFTTDKMWITRCRRPGEDNREYRFVTPSIVNRARSRLLLVESPYGEYQCALEWPQQLSQNEIRVRGLLPVNARHFLGQISVDSPSANVVCCAITPPADVDLTARLTARDSTMPQHMLSGRVEAAEGEMRQAREFADITFENAEGLERSVSGLRQLVENYCIERGY